MFSVTLMTGLLDVDYRIVVACRNGHIHTIKNGELSGLVIELESQPCGLVRTAKNIVVVGRCRLTRLDRVWIQHLNLTHDEAL